MPVPPSRPCLGTMAAAARQKTARSSPPPREGQGSVKGFYCCCCGGLYGDFLNKTKPQNKRAGEGLFTRACSDRTRGNSFKLQEDRFRQGTRKKFFTLSVARQWHRLPREAVAAPSLETFKARLDGALSNLV